MKSLKDISRTHKKEICITPHNIINTHKLSERDKRVHSRKEKKKTYITNTFKYPREEEIEAKKKVLDSVYSLSKRRENRN